MPNLKRAVVPFHYIIHIYIWQLRRQITVLEIHTQLEKFTFIPDIVEPENQFAPTSESMHWGWPNYLCRVCYPAII